MPVSRAKRHGIHYTPPELAAFLADVTVEQWKPSGETLTVLDPACGDGALLAAFAAALPPKVRRRVTLVGFETDVAALKRAEQRLCEVGVAAVDLKAQDFLTVAGAAVSSDAQRSFFESADDVARYDAVITNPPYVRTQVLGAARSQSLTKQFALSGRVDLYQAFVRATTEVLKPDGVLGLLTSNRFLTIRAGTAMRKLLRREFSLQSVYDLGDTKLFAAAVLPVIVVATKRPVQESRECRFDRIYADRSDHGDERPVIVCDSVLKAMRDRDVAGLVHTPTGNYRIERGALAIDGDEQLWSLSTPQSSDWLAVVSSRRACTFEDVAKIRVGIKTTADEVFLRDDWSALPELQQPELSLLRPLIRHFDAARWSCRQPFRQQVLYPYETNSEKRVPVDLVRYPRTRNYLESHFERLHRRNYVIEGGRRWYEIWVPHKPADWALPKIVFPDISEEPKFFLDRSGAVVNGDCYWITVREGCDADWLPLILAVANSSFITKYYDIAFHNKLYAGRRRFMTQFVKKFPLPDLYGEPSRRILRLTADLLRHGAADSSLSREIDRLVWNAFGLVEEVARERNL